jgi:hypothetical protein
MVQFKKINHGNLQEKRSLKQKKDEEARIPINQIKKKRLKKEKNFYSSQLQ